MWLKKEEAGYRVEVRSAACLGNLLASQVAFSRLISPYSRAISSIATTTNSNMAENGTPIHNGDVEMQDGGAAEVPALAHPTSSTQS